MSKKDEFKEFIKDKPSFVRHVNAGEISWQGLYELYDIYGENSDVFNEYLDKEKEEVKKDNDKDNSLKSIFSSLKDINMEEVKKNLNSLQKAVAFLEEFTTPDKKEEVVENVVNPRPLDNFFDD